LSKLVVGAPAFMRGKERFSALWSFYIFLKRQPPEPIRGS